MTGPPLREYESEVRQLTLEQVEALRAVAGRRLSITQTDVPGDWKITATCHVGIVVAGGVRVLIKPKIDEANLFHLLEAGGDPLEVRPEAFEYAQTSDLMASFATFYARVVEAAFGRGLHRAYDELEDRLVGVRGRVDVVAQRRQMGLSVPVACRFDEHTADVQLNRLLRAASERLIRLRGVTSSTRAALAAILTRLEEVGRLRTADLRVPTVFTRLNNHHRSAERLARIVLQPASLLDDAGDSEAGVFLVNMNLLFEEFVAVRLREYLTGSLDVVAQHGTWLDRDQNAVSMKPDLVFRRGGTPIMVGDTKYKLLRDEELGLNPDYYQLLAYTTALRTPQGVLIYCQYDGDPARPIVVKHAGTRLWVYGLRLDGSPAKVEERVHRLAWWIGNRCTEMSTDLVEAAGAAAS